LATLLAFRHLVQTYSRFFFPLTRIETLCRFGLKRRLVWRIECDTVMPTTAFLPQEKHL